MSLVVISPHKEKGRLVTLGLRLWCFYGDWDRWFVMREQFVGRDRRESPAFLLFMNEIDMFKYVG